MIKEPTIWIGTWYPNDDGFEAPHIGVFIVLPHDAEDIRNLNLAGEVQGVLAVSDFNIEECNPEQLDKFIHPWLKYVVKHKFPWDYDHDTLELVERKFVLVGEE